MWRKPECDGGSPLVGYTVEKKSVEKNSWVPCASVSGKMAMVAKELECEVKNLMEGGVYMFREAIQLWNHYITVPSRATFWKVVGLHIYSFDFQYSK